MRCGSNFWQHGVRGCLSQITQRRLPFASISTWADCGAACDTDVLPGARILPGMMHTAAQRSPHLPQALIVAMPAMVLCCSVLGRASLLSSNRHSNCIYIYCVTPHIRPYTVHHRISTSLRMELIAAIMIIRHIWNHVVALRCSRSSSAQCCEQ